MIDGATRSWLDRLLVSGDDIEIDVEQARDEMTDARVPAVVEYYRELDSWADRQHVIQLLQDHVGDAVTDVMVDFLRSPDDTTESRRLSWAVALGHVADEYDRFHLYSHDHAALLRDRAEVLFARDLIAEAPVDPPLPEPQRRVPPSRRRDNRARLLDAAELGAVTELLDVLASGVDRTAVGCSALMLATRAGSIDCVDALLTAGADSSYRRPGHDGDRSVGQTAMWWAATLGHIDIIDRLIEARADVDTPDHHGVTPVITALSGGYVNAARRLWMHGADPRRRSSDGRAALHLATQFGRVASVRFLLDEVGVDPDLRNNQTGGPPRMTAVSEHHPDIVELLLAAGADVEARHAGRWIYHGSTGMTPLAIAVANGRVRLAQRLLAAGADPTAEIPHLLGKQSEAPPPRTAIDFATGRRAERLRDMLALATAQRQFR